MASQFSKATSSSPVSPTSTSKHEYDVLLSFSWEDIGESFADHLYAALVEKGFHPFRDAIGKPHLSKRAIASESLMTIEKSKLFVVIFSENYARSGYNLDQLVKIIECTQATRKAVVPVFYHVDPSVVREQRGSYGEAFYNHELANQEKEKMHNWRIALKEVSNLSGYHLVDNQGYESATIMEITDSIMDRLKHEYFGNSNLVGIDCHLEELKSLIGMGFPDVRMLGLYGIGGIGKSTIVKAIYNSISCKFDGISFLTSVREGSIPQLQKILLMDITGEINKNLDNVDEGINKIKEKLQQKKVLIILDDVDSLAQLECLIGNRDWFGGGSRIIITTRDKHLLVVHGVDAIYEVPGLDFEESMHLFSLHAFKQRFPMEAYVELSRYIVDYTAGLPLALKVLGILLYGKTTSEWESLLDKLKCRPMKEIHNALLISINKLDYEALSIFLDITCFLKGERREFVSRILGRRAEQVITRLCDMSLLTFSNNKILIYPLVQQMGQEIVCQAWPRNPENWSRLWRSEDVYHTLCQNKGTEVIEGIFLNTPASEPIEFTTEAFDRMTRLRLFKVHQDRKCGSMVQKYELDVSTSFEFPSYELRYLHWDGYPLESLPSNFNGANLIELNLQYSKLRGLWKRSKILEKLKVINLSHSQQLIQIPDLSNAPNLESLILEGCTNLKKLPRRIWELDSLANLDLSHCSELQNLPGIQWSLNSLEYLNLAFCKKLKSLPRGLYNLKCLKTLNVIGCSRLCGLPKSLESLECLEKLCASHANLISSQPHFSLTGLCSLRILDVHGTCLMQGAISRDIGSLYSLEELDLSYCNLTEGGIPDDICCLYSLRVLDLSGNHFLRVTNAISQLSKLRVLRLRHCMSLLEIPELPQSLRVLDAHDCISMDISSSTSMSPWERQLNCFKSYFLQESQELRYRRLLSLPANGVSQGFSIVIPGNGEFPKWISYQRFGSEVIAVLPQNWYMDRDFLGFALCCVYAPQQGEPVDEPESSISKHESDEESENAMQPYRLGCELTFLKDTIGTLDFVFCGSSCQCDHDDGVSDSVWVTYYSTLAIKKKYFSDEARHLKASFTGYVDCKPVMVEKCGIGLVYADLKKIHGGAGSSGVRSGKI